MEIQKYRDEIYKFEQKDRPSYFYEVVKLKWNVTSKKCVYAGSGRNQMMCVWLLI